MGCHVAASRDPRPLNEESPGAPLPAPPVVSPATGMACSTTGGYAVIGKAIAHLFPRRHGCVFCLRRGALRSIAEGQTRGGRRTAQRTRSRVGGILCGPRSE